MTQKSCAVGMRNAILRNYLKDVRAHCYCASLLRTQYMTWRLPRHVFQARAPSRNSTKYRADELCGNLISEYFCWMHGDPHFFFGRSLPFLILFFLFFFYFFIEIHALLAMLTTLLTIFMQLFTLITILLTYATYNNYTYTTCITYNTIRLLTLLTILILFTEW